MQLHQGTKIVCDILMDSFNRSYFQTIGACFGSSISESMSVDVTVEASLRASFWKIFEAGIGVSETTGYDWTTTSDAAMAEQVTVEVKTTVDPGYILQIKQAVGKCGDSNSKTELFKIVHIEGKTGRIVKEEFERTIPDKNAVKVLDTICL